MTGMWTTAVAARWTGPKKWGTEAHFINTICENAGDPLYKNMAGNFKTSMAYQAACDLVFQGLTQPSGYTEPLLRAWRWKV